MCLIVHFCLHYRTFSPCFILLVDKDIENEEGKEEETRRFLILQWGHEQNIIKAPTFWFAMAAIDDQLIIAGGGDSNDHPLDQIFMLKEDKTWTQPFPAMPTARYGASAIGYKKWLVVAGGNRGEDETDAVEVLDTSSKWWYKMSPLPSPAVQPSLVIIQDNLYINVEDDVYQMFIPTLISNAICRTHTSHRKPSFAKWEALPDICTKGNALISFHGHLLAVGIDGTFSSTISMYFPHLKQWQNVAKLPISHIFGACCVTPTTKELMIFGGLNTEDEENRHTSTVEICELDTTNEQPFRNPLPFAKNFIPTCILL